MSRQSRFSKLEGERGPVDEQVGTGASLERFAAEPPLALRADPADPMAPLPNAERLGRFDADGADGLGLDRDLLAELPTLQCAGCGAECGKFETQCHRCRASLTTPAVRDHNLARLNVAKQERAQALADREQAIAAEVQAQTETNQARAASLASHDVAGPPPTDTARASPGPRLGVLGAALLFTLITGGALRVLAAAIAIGALLSLLPQSVWIALGGNARDRGRD